MIRDATPTRAICRHCRRPIHLHDGVWAVDLGGVLREKCRWTKDKNNRAHVPLTPAPDCATI